MRSSHENQSFYVAATPIGCNANHVSDVVPEPVGQVDALHECHINAAQSGSNRTGKRGLTAARPERRETLQ